MTPKATFLSHVGQNCMVVSCITYVDTVSVTIPDLLWELYSSNFFFGTVVSWVVCVVTVSVASLGLSSIFAFVAGHQLTEHERDELLATTAYFFVQRSLRARTFKNQEK